MVGLFAKLFGWLRPEKWVCKWCGYDHLIRRRRQLACETGTKRSEPTER